MREKVSQDIREQLQKRAVEFGLILEDISITDLHFQRKITLLRLIILKLRLCGSLVMKVHLRRSVWRQHPPSSPVREMAATVWQQNLSRRKKNLSAVAQRRRQRRRRQRQRRRWHSDESSIPSNRVSCR